jgi:hypothetical protein
MTNPVDLPDEVSPADREHEPEGTLHREAPAHFEPQTEQEDLTASGRTQSSNIGLFTFIGGFVFVALAVMAGYIYLIEPTPIHRFPSLDDQGLATPTPPASSGQAASPAASTRAFPTPPNDVKLRDDLPITADMLHVTATALGSLHLTIVNGKRLAEGDWLKVKVGNDTGALQVMKIEDGMVHFKYGSRMIDAKLAVKLKQATPHPH